jgi:bifunctional enzyme CysN/CysC
MMDAGLIVMTAFISPFRAEREMARELLGAENFIEVFLDVPLEICEQRDPKGLYKKARGGQLPNMTGINSPYEPPTNPECLAVKANQDVKKTVRLIIDLLEL